MRFLTVIFLIIVFLGCKKDKSVEVIEVVVPEGTLTYCDTVTVSFSTQIQPIFIQSCATSGCHDAASGAAGYVLESHSQLSDDNIIKTAFKTIKHDPNVSPMPKFQAKLNDSLIQQIQCWIDQGKLDN